MNLSHSIHLFITIISILKYLCTCLNILYLFICLLTYLQIYLFIYEIICLSLPAKMLILENREGYEGNESQISDVPALTVYLSIFISKIPLSSYHRSIYLSIPFLVFLLEARGDESQISEMFDRAAYLPFISS